MKVVHRWSRSALSAGNGLGGVARIASAVVGTNLITSALGTVFWVIAGRGLAPAQLGTLGAATAASMLLGVVASLGLGPLLISELPRLEAGQRWDLFRTAMLTSLTAGVVLAGLFGAVVGTTGTTWAPLRAPGWVWCGFVLATGLQGTSLILDQAMLVIGNPLVQVWRNAVASVAKVLVVAVLLAAGSLSLAGATAAWATGAAIASAVAVRAARRRFDQQPRGNRTATLPLVRTHARDALTHQAVNLGLASGSMLMPIVISWVIEPAENGLYTAARLVAMIGLMLPYALSLSMFADRSAGGFDPRQGRKVLVAALAVSLSVAGLTWVAAGPLLRLFGAGYEQGVPVLRIMVLSGPLLVFKDQFIAIARLNREVHQIWRLVLAAAALELLFAVVGAHLLGVRGAVIGWVLALAAQAPYAVWRILPSYRLGEMGPVTTVQIVQGGTRS